MHTPVAQNGHRPSIMVTLEERLTLRRRHPHRVSLHHCQTSRCTVKSNLPASIPVLETLTGRGRPRPLLVAHSRTSRVPRHPLLLEGRDSLCRLLMYVRRTMRVRWMSSCLPVGTLWYCFSRSTGAIRNPVNGRSRPFRRLGVQDAGGAEGSGDSSVSPIETDCSWSRCDG